MITTPELIEALTAQTAPVRPLRPPLRRAANWILLAGAILLLLALVQGVRSDLFERLREPAFALGLIGAYASGVLAAVAAFLLSLPDRSSLWLWLPAPAVALWVTTIGYGCLTDWVSLDPGDVRLGSTARCFVTLVLTSIPLSLALLVMLRHAAPLRPTGVAVAGGLAVAGMTATALSLFHDIDATIMVLLWNIGTAALIVLAGGAFGRRMFAWFGPRPVEH